MYNIELQVELSQANKRCVCARLIQARVELWLEPNQDKHKVISNSIKLLALLLKMSIQ